MSWLEVPLSGKNTLQFCYAVDRVWALSLLVIAEEEQYHRSLQ